MGMFQGRKGKAVLLFFAVFGAAGCGAVFVNEGSKNASLLEGIRNPAAYRAIKPANLKDASLVFIDDNVGVMYTYGGQTNASTTDDTSYSGSSSLQCNLDSSDYSGVIVPMAQAVDLTKARAEGQVLRFAVKGTTGGEPIEVALTDAGDDGKEVEIVAKLGRYGTVGTDWKVIQIPLKDFPDIGGYWDGTKVVEGVPFEWNRVAGFRVRDNKSGRGLYTVYVDEVVVSPSLK